MKFKIKTKFVVILVVSCSMILALVLAKADSSSSTKEGHILIDNPGNNGSFFISIETAQNDTISPILRANFPFNALFVNWEYNSTQVAPDMYVRFLNEEWSGWEKIVIDDDTGRDGSKPTLFSQMISTKPTDTFQYKISFANSETKKDLNNLNFTYLDTTKGPSSDLKISSSQETFQIISRRVWGADDNYRFDQTGNELWPEDYYTPKRFIIHHTAGENANVDSMATLRAIYYWHSKGRDWGDIGYNYLIDSKGNIYEGRNGGDGVVGGHALNNNQGSIGIAILGCYEDQNEKKNNDCNTPDHLTEAAKNALDKLIAEKSREFDIDPMGQSEYKGKMMPNVMGHRDVGQTDCPGNLIYNQLPQIRQLAYNILQNLGGYEKPLPTAAQFVKTSASEINVEDTKSSNVIVEFKNTGQEVWRGYEDNYLYIAEAGIKNKLAKIDDYKMALETGDKDSDTPTSDSQIYKMIGGNVYPGQIGQFKLVLEAPQESLTETKNFVLAWSDKGYFPNTDFSLAINKVPCTTDCNGDNKQNTSYVAELVPPDFPETMATGSSQKLVLQFKNNGTTAWLAGWLKLNLTNGNDLQGFDNEELIGPGSIATFNLQIKAPATPGQIQYDASLFYDGQKILDVTKNIQVIAPYSALITANTLPDSMVRNTRKTVVLTFKNTGTKTWKLPTLKSYDIDGTNSWFKDWSWLNSKAVAQVKKTVKPGEEITFKFKILAYWKANSYPQVFKLLDGKNEIYLGSTKEYKITTIVTKK